MYISIPYCKFLLKIGYPQCQWILIIFPHSLKWPFGVMGHLHKHQPSQMTPMTCWFCLKAGYLIPSNVFSACSYQKGYLFDGYHPTVNS